MSALMQAMSQYDTALPALALLSSFTHKSDDLFPAVKKLFRGI